MAARIAYWLMPEKTIVGLWRKAVDRLATEYGSVPFDPHVTLYVHQQANNPSCDRIIESCGYETVVLETTGLCFSDLFTKSCYIQFRQCPEIMRLYEQIKGASKNPDDYTLDPHMSLFYGDLAETDRQQIHESIKLPASISFTTIRAVLIPDPVLGPDNVKSWKYLSES